MTKFLKPLLLSTAGLLCAGIAIASPKADINNDGQITQAEFLAEADTRFNATDTNFDGLLTKEEIKAAREAKRAERKAKIDTNGDGTISDAEKDAAKALRKEKKQARKLAKLDTNGDGTISDAEKDAAKALRDERRAERKAKKKERKAEKGEKGRKGEKRALRGDTNEDGVISRAEFDTATIALFERLDANADGVLTEGEGKKRRGKKGGKRGDK